MILMTWLAGKKEAKKPYPDSILDLQLMLTYQCKCKDPNASACGSEQYKGDGNCDDENNVADCDFDGGDCCGSNVKKAYCEQVATHLHLASACA